MLLTQLNHENIIKIVDVSCIKFIMSVNSSTLGAPQSRFLSGIDKARYYLRDAKAL